jgi:hypothetical protein
MGKISTYFPQVTFDRLPVLQEGEELENENEEMTTNIINGSNSWTIGQRRKNKK